MAHGFARPRPTIDDTFLELRARRSGASSLAAPSVADTLRADQRRAEYILRRVSGHGSGAPQLWDSKAAATTTVPASWGYDIDTLNYVVTASLGTPGVAQTMEVDTGSDLSWVQCKPCAAAPSCYSQKDPLFDPAQSSSYAVVPYGDGSNTTGVYSSDTLTLSASSAVQGFFFGCGHAQSGLFNGVDGLLGLGREQSSLVEQTAGTYGGVFSYCLPTKPSTAGYLTLGGPAGAASGFSTTQLLPSPNAPTYYVVMLTGISVGGQQLSVPASAFAGGTAMTQLLKGINSYMSSLKVPTLSENKNAACLAEQLTRQFKGQECTNTSVQGGH
ncbi:Aspartyl protease AED1 [Zea mays]|uniref:Aspartyl protease AED1 n=1 Tax=Zea mays TaxID=4577 RepID=A0A1D6M238_MAIZE|nr:Aspartyl protease AED1 [Zea mays]